MDILIPYTATAADMRFFHQYERGLKRERITQIVCNILKWVSKIILGHTSLLFGLGVISLPIIAVLISGGTLPLVALVAIPILLGLLIVNIGIFGINDICKKRANLAAGRLRYGNRELIEQVETLRRGLENRDIPGIHLAVPSNSEAAFFERIGVFSRESRKLINVINRLNVVRNRLRRTRHEVERQRFIANWEVTRMQLQNDLPSELILREV